LILKTGILTISLDFELHWGVSETRSVESYRENLLGTRAAITGILQLFDKYQVHATWATVGMLFCKNKMEMMKYVNAIDKPQYVEKKLCNFSLAHQVGNDASDDPYHFAPEVIVQIANYPNQEISTHTFSHYYCLEEGQSVKNFKSDLKAAIAIAGERSIHFHSIIFPRNQYSQDYLDVCKQNGITIYRGNQKSWMYASLAKKQYKSRVRRLARLLDAYIGPAGQHSFEIKKPVHNSMLNIPGSRLLRPYSKSLRLLEPLRMKRIKQEMTFAARHKKVYHLWWHPHNFGKHIQENLANLEDLLAHYKKLNLKYGFTSMNMAEIGNVLTTTA
jgi:hypothetical protein